MPSTQLHSLFNPLIHSRIWPGNPLYPLRWGDLPPLFLFWILARVYAHRNSLAGLVYFFFLFISYRYLLGNLSSPTSDQLVQICLSWSLLQIAELLFQKRLAFLG